MAQNIVEVADQDFDAEVLKSDVPVMLDMWAPWCGPCRLVSPVIEELAAENAGKVKVCKMNVDENAEAAGRYGITGIPTVLFFQGGKEISDKRLVGVRPKREHQTVVDQLATDSA